MSFHTAVKFRLFFVFAILLFSFFSLVSVSAADYVTDISLYTPKSIYNQSDQLELVGTLSVKNYSDAGALLGESPYYNAIINISLSNSSGVITRYNLTTDSNGYFYSKNSYRTNATLITAPNSTGTYTLTASFKNLNNETTSSQLSIEVANRSIDRISVSSDKSTYNPSETIYVLLESFQELPSGKVYSPNITLNGSVRNVTSNAILSLFNCTTGNDGRCTTSISAPSTYGSYMLEVNSFKDFSSFNVVPFSASIYMKDDLNSLKNTFAVGEKAGVEVSVSNSTTAVYTFSGYVADSAGNVVETINSTTLNSNNSYTNKFIFTVSAATFDYGTYYAYVTLTKTGGNSIDLYSSFEVRDWMLSVNKRETASGFEYDYFTFANKTLYFDIYPKYRSNGTVIQNINASSFLVNLTDKLGNSLANTSVAWNASCGKEGCYYFSINSSSNLGKHSILVTLSSGGEIQEKKISINVIDTVISSQSTNLEGSVKELFGTNEYVYISLNSYNTTTSLINLTDATIFSVEYMNGTSINFTSVTTFDLVNSTNNVSEWAWNTSQQRFKLDVPKSGGIYNVVILAKNQTANSNALFITNPYDICSATKNTPGSVSSGGGGSSGYYYVWQFKTTETIYFELKIIQANNPLGRATASNFSSGNSSSQYGFGSACNVNTQTQQVVNNATLAIVSVRNTQNGEEYAINTSASSCFSIDNSGGYTCTVAPATKWDGGTYAVEMKATGLDGSSDIVHGLFEARSFYLYGYSTVWQNSPSANISLNVKMYEAGKTWWSNYGSGGLSGTISVSKIEYMGKDGDWIWPPVDSGYNVSSLNSTSISTGSGTVSIPVSATKKGTWDIGNYRVVLKGVDSAGNTDYGYSWFTIKRWDVYASPVSCTGTDCNYKSYFNSKENITLYVKIGNAGAYNYNEGGGEGIGGNVTVGVKKIEDCRSYPCKELNSSVYSAAKIIVNSSSPWYWNSAAKSNSSYLLQINRTSGTWESGWFNVILDVNGTDTGYAYFNAIAFYIDARPTDINGTNWKYNIRPAEPMYFNTTLTKNYVSYSYVYNQSDYINGTISDAVLRVWDTSTFSSKEFNYPEDINISIVNKTTLAINTSALVNITYKNGSWPTGYYSGEINIKNNDNETANAWIWFSVQPFRAEITNNNYEIDSTSCLNTTLTIRDPDWYANSILYGNYTIIGVKENVWSNSGNSVVTYTNYTNTSFNGTVNSQFCPNSGGSWGSGNWGGYHYLDVLVRDNSNNNTQSGWVSFRTVPFRVSFSVVGGSDRRTNENANITVTLTKAVTGNSTLGNLTRLYQWRYDSTTSYSSTLEEYTFTVYTNGSTCSSSSGSCMVNGTATIVLSAPSTGWRVGGNYIQAEWEDTTGSAVSDYNSIYLNGLNAYNGWFDSVNTNGGWVSGYAPDQNVTLRLNVRNASYNSLSVNISSIQYGKYSSGCYSDYCATYSTATWSFVSGGSGVQLTNGNGIVTMQKPSSNWEKGDYTVKMTVTGSAGTSTITGSTFRIKDFTAPNITISAPTVNQTINASTFSITTTTTESSTCSITALDYLSFRNWYCGALNATNGSITQAHLDSCNQTYFGFNNATNYQVVYVYPNSYSFYNNTYSQWESVTGISTGGTTHTYTMNTTRWRNQDYGMQFYCYDVESNYALSYVSFHLNKTS